MSKSGRVVMQGEGAIKCFFREEAKRPSANFVWGVLCRARNGEVAYLVFNKPLRVRESCTMENGNIRPGSITETRMERMRHRVMREENLL